MLAHECTNATDDQAGGRAVSGPVGICIRVTASLIFLMICLRVLGLGSAGVFDSVFSLFSPSGLG